MPGTLSEMCVIAGYVHYLNEYIVSLYYLPIKKNPVKQRDDQFPQKIICSMAKTSPKFQLQGGLVWRFQPAIAVS